MGSDLKLPIIDFSNLKHGTPMWESVKKQVSLAAQEFGAFEVMLNEIPLSPRKSIFAASEELFNLPLEIKLRNKSTLLPYYGYIASPHAPLYESLGIEDAFSHGNIERFTNLWWPQGNPTLSQALSSFSEQLSELDQTIRKMVLEIFGLKKYEDEHMESANYLIRLQKYNGPQSHETKVGLLSHTDKTIVSILFQNEVNGLQVMTMDGQWISFEPSLNSFIVLFGDCFHAWTNGRINSSHHRVMMTGDIDRYSIGLFSMPKEGCIIRTPDEMVDEDHPLLYKPFNYAEYRTFVYSEKGQKSPFPLKEFCGV